MLDINLFRDDPDTIKKSEKRRGKDPGRVDTVKELDERWRETRQNLDELRHEVNTVSREIAEKKKNGESAEDAIQRMQQVKEQIADLEKQEDELLEERDEVRYRVGNILHEEVPTGEDEDDNKELKVVGEKPDINDPVHHADMVEQLDAADTEKAGDVAGSRFYYMKGDLVNLHLAAQQFALRVLQEHGFQAMYTPFMLKHEHMAAAAELDDFEETLYRVEDGDEDKFLIATSEQTLAAYHYDEILEPDSLPLKYAGISSCFRREAGSHGKDTKGIFRVHQFEKVEQFIFSDPDESWKHHEELLDVAETVMQQLGLHYRVVDVCTGDMNDNAARKYDIEAWYPAQEAYRELVSCSNNTDYQARKLKVRMRGEDNPTVHVLNSTAWPGQRGLTAILVQNQMDDGRVKIPDVLQDYMGGQEYLYPADR